MARVSVPFTCGERGGERPRYYYCDFVGFEAWLYSQKKRKRTVRDTLFYAKKFAYVLDSGDATPILTQVKPLSQKHVLSALANLSKYQGRYEQWNQIRRNYNLHWVKADSITHFERFFSEELTLDTMIQRIKEMIRLLPPPMGQIIKFGSLIGARCTEIIECVKLINNPETFSKLYNPQRQALEYFRFPDIFLRETKKLYVSFVRDDILDIVKGIQKAPSRNAIGKACQRRGIKTEMHLTRKLFASWLRKEGVQAEVVELLSGRVPPNILTRHYMVPTPSFKGDVLAAIEKLKEKI
jgi:hypothetical protein